MSQVPVHIVARAVRRALLEDIGPGDLTTDSLVDPGARARGRIVAVKPLVLAGLTAARLAFLHLDPKASFPRAAREGERLDAGQAALEVHASARSLLMAERTALNFACRLSGVATLTRQCVEEVEGTGCLVYDTRKTTPGWRPLEREAVALGGGRNHRFGLFDAVLIKDNHREIAGGAAGAVRLVRSRAGEGVPVEVEIDDLSDLPGVLEAGADIVLLDNMPLESIREAARLRDSWLKKHPGRAALLEASGGITPGTIGRIASCGVDRVSLGALTHSAPAADLRLEIEAEPS